MSLPARLWLLYSTFARIAALVVGGGYAMLPVIEETFVKKYKILTPEELVDMVALVQTLPGIIAVNSAMYIGMKVAGYAGAILAVAGAVTPSYLVIVIIAAFFPHLDPKNVRLLGAFAGVRACITGLIIMTAWRTARKTLTGWLEATSAAVCLILVLFGCNPLYIILTAIPYGIGLLKWRERQRNEKQEDAAS